MNARPKTLGLRATAVLLLAAVGGLTVGCAGSSDPEPAPTACLDSSSSYLDALQRAPERVALVEGVRISDCVVPAQSGGELANIGAELITAASRLAASTRAGGTDADADALELGFLVGAVRRGAERTGGIHSDLVRRLESTAKPATDSEYARAYVEGLRAGLSQG